MLIDPQAHTFQLVFVLETIGQCLLVSRLVSMLTGAMRAG